MFFVDWSGLGLDRKAALKIQQLHDLGIYATYGPGNHVSYMRKADVRPSVCWTNCAFGVPYINGRVDIHGAVAALVGNAQRRCAALGIPATCYSGFLVCGGKKSDISCGWNKSQPDSWRFSCGGRSIVGTVCFDRNYFAASSSGSKLAGWVKAGLNCGVCKSVALGAGVALYCYVQPESWVAAAWISSAAGNPEAAPLVAAGGCAVVGAAAGAGVNVYGP